jgi:hypothetical protein
MNTQKYTLKAEANFIRFEFVSEGFKGFIKKLIEFQETNNPQVFNLAFGDKNNLNDAIDDLIVSDNGDAEKVLATVVAAIYVFFDYHPDVFVYITGSTDVRTRLYRIGISKYYNELINDFHIYGLINNEFKNFNFGVKYEGFLAQKK